MPHFRRRAFSTSFQCGCILFFPMLVPYRISISNPCRRLPYDSMINHQHQFIFVHIPKTAGKSVQRFFGAPWHPHKDLSRYAAELEPAIFDRYYKFTIIRNPWDRILSDYNFQIRKRTSSGKRLCAHNGDGEILNFREWLEAVFSNPYRYSPADWGGCVSPTIHRWSPQVDWISMDGQVAVDGILRMDNLREDFDKLCLTLNRPCRRLPCRNWKFHWHYSHYFNDPTRKLVEEFYRKDIEAFGFRFESRKRDIKWLLSEKIAIRMRSVLRQILNPFSF